jgi:hypothetical protein
VVVVVDGNLKSFKSLNGVVIPAWKLEALMAICESERFIPYA